jgi:hypothetical protein
MIDADATLAADDPAAPRISALPEPVSAPPQANEAEAAGSGREIAGTDAGAAERTSWLWGAVVLAGCLLVALVATWPLAANLGNAVPLATEHALTVQLFSIWTLWWTADRAAHGFAGYWDAPSFYPNTGVFTFSEPEPLTGLAVAPLWWLQASPALIHNVALLLVLVLNGIFAYRLARALALPRPAALASGLIMVALPFAANMYGVINLLPVFGMLWTLEGLVLFGREGRTRHAVWAALGFVAAFLTCQQYAMMFALFAGAAGLVALAQQQFKLPAVIRLGAAGLSAGVIVLAVAWPGLSLHRELGFTRADYVVEGLSATPGDFFTRPETAWLNLPPRHGPTEDTGGLFPGAVLLALSVAGAVVGIRDPNPRLRRWSLFLAIGALAAAVLAMGLNVSLFGWRPYDMLRSLVPGFSEFRSVYRFTIIVQLMLAILAALALARLGTRIGRWGPAVVLTLAALAVAENLTVPLPLAAIPPTPRTAWTEWLRAQPADTVVAHIPFATGTTVKEHELDAWYMYAQIDHGKPIVNGYSGWFPPGYTPFQLEMAQLFPQHGLLCTLNKGLRVNTLVVDASWHALRGTELAAFSEFLTTTYTDDQVLIYRLAMPDSKCTPEP